MEKSQGSLVVGPSEVEVTSTVIWLHGLGADAEDFHPIISELGIKDGHGVKFIFPQAPVRSITINSGMKMQGWYDIKSLDLTFQEDTDGINDSVNKLHELINKEIESGIKPNKIILAGFSQGGAIALQAALRYSKPLGGVIAISTYLPLAEELKSKIKKEVKGLPICMVHGLFDPVVPLNVAQKAKQWLEGMDFDIYWKTYPIAHNLCGDQINDMAAWLRKYLQLSAIVEAVEPEEVAADTAATEDGAAVAEEATAADTADIDTKSDATDEEDTSEQAQNSQEEATTDEKNDKS